MNEIKTLVKTISTNFPNYKFSICRNACFYDLIVKIKPVNKTETLLIMVATTVVILLITVVITRLQINFSLSLQNKILELWSL